MCEQEWDLKQRRLSDYVHRIKLLNAFGRPTRMIHMFYDAFWHLCNSKAPGHYSLYFIEKSSVDKNTQVWNDMRLSIGLAIYIWVKYPFKSLSSICTFFYEQCLICKNCRLEYVSLKKVLVWARWWQLHIYDDLNYSSLAGNPHSTPLQSLWGKPL